MTEHDENAKTALSCACGKVQMMVRGCPIVVAECYCRSCRDGAERMAALPGAQPVVGENGSSHYVLYRKDRLRITQGRDWLRNFRLSPERQTRRVFASCCNTPVLTEFKGGHWASLYANLWHGHDLPQPELRTQTGDAMTALDDRIPSGRWETTKFFGKLLAAWAAMGFRSPSVALDTPEVELKPVSA